MINLNKSKINIYTNLF